MSPRTNAASPVSRRLPEGRPEGDVRTFRRILEEQNNNPLPIVSRAVTGPNSEQGPGDKQDYENDLNALAVGLTDGVITQTVTDGVVTPARELIPLTDDELGKHYKDLILYKLREQAANGEQVNLGKALSDVNDELFDRLPNAVRGDDDGDLRIDIIKGYWDRHDGKEHATDLATSAFWQYYRDNRPTTDNSDYGHNLNALASLLVSGTLADDRKLAIGLSDETARELYKNLITAKLEEQGYPLNQSAAFEEINEELFDRIGNAAENSGADAGDIVNVIEGYWDRHGGKRDATTYAREAFNEYTSEFPPTDDQISQATPESDFDGTLNAVAAAMASGVNVEDGKVTPFTGSDIRDGYATLVYAKLEEQQANGDPIDLDAAYDAVRNELLDRLPTALRDDPDADEKMGLLEDYWKEDGSKSDASGIAREAYSQFLADTVSTDNPDYEDNLNALALGFGGGPIDDTRTLSGLRDGTLGELYKNLITDKLKNGTTLDDAIEQVNTELFDRLPHALRNHSDGDGKIDIINGYWERHGGKLDATRLGEDAYAEYVAGGGEVEDGEDLPEILDSAATDFLNAETLDGRTVIEVFMEKLQEAYGDEPTDSIRAKYLRLLQAQGIMGGGFEYLPYWHKSINDSTRFADEPSEMSEVQIQGLLDGEKLDEVFSEVAGNEEIAIETEQFLREAVSEIKDKKGLENRIVATMLSPTYKEEVLSLGGGAESMQRFASDIRSLSMLNPERAIEIQQQLSFGSAFEELSGILSDPEAIDSETIELAADDVAYTMVTAEIKAAYGPAAAADFIAAFNEYREGKELKDIRLGGNVPLTPAQMDELRQLDAENRTLKNLIIDQATRQNGGILEWASDPNNQRTFNDILQNDRDIRNAMDKAGVSRDIRGSVLEKLQRLSSSGALTTAGGVGCLVAAVMTLTEDGGKNLTTEERLNAAFFLLFTGSGVPQAAQQITGGLEKLLKIPGMQTAIGLDKNFNNVWGKPGPDTNATPTSSANRKLWTQIRNSLGDVAGQRSITAFNNMPSQLQQALMARVNKLAEGMGKAGTTLSATDKLKLIGPGLKALASASFLAGSGIGIFLGAKGLKDAETPLERAIAGLNLGAGIAWTGAATASMASRFVGPLVGAALGMAGAALTGIGLILSAIPMIIAGILQYKKKQEAAENVRDFFRQLGNDGVTKDDWGDKLNYLIHVEYMYNKFPDEMELNYSADEWFNYYFPKDMPPWEAQPEHFEAFTEANNGSEDGGTSINWWYPVPRNFDESPLALLEGHGDKPEGVDAIDPGYSYWNRPSSMPDAT